MSRPLSIEEPGLWHHVMNRGASRQDTLRAEEDCRSFLGLVTEAGERWKIRVHAAALMPNRFHLLVEDTDGHLSRGMRHILGVYTQRFNRRHSKDGALFRGCYRSHLLQSEEYLSELVRYIHLNPVRARLVERAGDYPWSSHRHELGRKERAPNWLQADEAFTRFGGDTPRGRSALDSFVHEPFVHEPFEPRLAALLSHQPWRPVVGTPDFVGRWRKTLRDTRPEPSVKVPEHGRLLSVTAHVVMMAVTQHFQVEPSELSRSPRATRRSNLPRSIALVLLVAGTRLTHSEVAEALSMKSSTVGSLAFKHRKNIQDSPELKREMAASVLRIGAC